MRTFVTYNNWHLGDSLIHLNFLRRLAILHPEIGFMHRCDPRQHAQLAELIGDIPAIRLGVLPAPPGSIDSWKNAGAQNMNAHGQWSTPGFFDTHPLKNDWVNFHIDWFKVLAQKMDLESPIHLPFHLLFDYPAIKRSDASRWDFDFLVINSRPGSGQVSYRDNFCFDPLIAALKQKGYRVACTQETRVPEVFCTAAHHLTVTDIGNLSLRTPYIVGVSTGAAWITHNVHNIESVKYRIIMLDRERLNLPGNGCHVATVEEITEKLRQMKLI